MVSFHSLEDRLVKRFLAERSGRIGGGSRHLPAYQGPRPSFGLTSNKSVVAGDKEVAANPRSRSARMRAGERTDAPPIELNAKALGLPVFEEFREVRS